MERLEWHYHQAYHISAVEYMEQYGPEVLIQQRSFIDPRRISSVFSDILQRVTVRNVNEVGRGSSQLE